MFSHTNSTGTFFTTAKFSVSWKMPSSTVPSPKKAHGHAGSPSMAKASAEPTATAMVWPRMADEASTPASGPLRWTEPPRPRAQPVSFP